MSHKDDIAVFLKAHPNEWFTKRCLWETLDFPPTNVHKYLSRLIYWDDHFEEKIDEESGLLVYRYHSEV